jgi:hypothetical protein
MTDINYINLFDLSINIDNFEIPNIILSTVDTIEKWIIHNNQYPIFFQISNFFLQFKDQYISIDTKNVTFNTLNSNMKQLQSTVNFKIEKNRHIKNYYKGDNLIKYNTLLIKFEKKIVKFFDTENNVVEYQNLAETINRKCSVIVQPRLIINHYKKKINLQLYAYQIKIYPEKIITLADIYQNGCLFNDKYGEEKCPICYQEIEEDNKGIAKLYCKHIFHLNCINRWFKQKEIDNQDLVCPVCRKKHIINIS